jgi:peptidoglycan/xylan/chitin deacetylase (PgdA/CDA1 family)
MKDEGTTQRIVTTSWDDGDPLDLRVAEMLGSRGVKGTFYIPVIGYNGRTILQPQELRGLADGFEIGAHGMSHQVLPKFHGKELKREVHVCKRRLEDVLGETVVMFSYPKGRYSARVIREVKKAGYLGARTTKMFHSELATDPFRLATTLGAFSNSRKEYLKNCLRGMNLSGALGCALNRYPMGNWVELAKQTFDRVMRKGGVWHLYGHSWVLEEHGLWGELEEVLQYVGGRRDVTYASNRELLTFIPSRAPMIGTAQLLQK